MILTSVQTCKAHSGDNYTTLAGTKLTVGRKDAAHSGRHLLQVSRIAVRGPAMQSMRLHLRSLA